MENKNILQGIDTVIIRVSDIKKSKQWYREKLDLKVIWEDDNIKLVVLDTGSPTSLTLWQTDKTINNDKETASYPIFRIINATDARDALLEKGVNVSDVVEDSSVNYFFFYDTDGNVLEACQVHG